MSITNPTGYVTVRRLNRFKQKNDDLYATKQELEDAEVASMFRLFVDPADMHLKGRNVAGGTFEVVNGHLIMHQTQ
jgi:hypothetical protein